MRTKQRRLDLITRHGHRLGVPTAGIGALLVAASCGVSNSEDVGGGVLPVGADSSGEFNMEEAEILDSARRSELSAMSGLDRSAGFGPVGSWVWQNYTVKYAFDSTISQCIPSGCDPVWLSITSDVIPHYEERTSIKFVKVEASSSDPKVLIKRTTSSTACAYDHVTNTIEVNGCGTSPTPALRREWGHAVGLLREHQRPDRDAYVNVTCTGSQYDKELAANVHLFGEYDTTSLMQFATGTTPNPQCITLKPFNATIPVPTELSDKDIRGIQVLWGAQYQSTLSAVSWGSNRVDVFFRASDGSVGHQAWSGSWAAGSLGGTILGAPKAVSHASNRLHVFVRDTNRRLRVKEFDGSSWDTSWGQLGNETLASDPTAVSWGQNHVAIFAKHDDGSVRVKTWNGSSYGSWTNLGGFSKGPVEAVSWGANRLDVFTVGTDGAVYHKWFSNGSWGPSQSGAWQRLGGFVAGKPTAVSWGSNRIDLFVKGEDHELYHKYWNGSDWLPSEDGSWEDMGGSIVGHPVAESWGSNRIDLFWQASNGELRTKVYDNGWFTSTALSGANHLVGSPEVVSWGPNRIDVFARDRSNDLRHKAWDGSQGTWAPANTTNSRNAQITW